MTIDFGLKQRQQNLTVHQGKTALLTVFITQAPYARIKKTTVSSTNTVLTTDRLHLLEAGDYIHITQHDARPSLNGVAQVTAVPSGTEIELDQAVEVAGGSKGILGKAVDISDYAFFGAIRSIVNPSAGYTINLPRLAPAEGVVASADANSRSLLVEGHNNFQPGDRIAVNEKADGTGATLVGDERVVFAQTTNERAGWQASLLQLDSPVQQAFERRPIVSRSTWFSDLVADTKEGPQGRAVVRFPASETAKIRVPPVRSGNQPELRYEIAYKVGGNKYTLVYGNVEPVPQAALV